MKLLEAIHVLPHDVIAAVGAGGKTTLLDHLAAELAARGFFVVSTTTTHIWEPAGTVVIESSNDALITAVARRVQAGQVLTVASSSRFVIDEETGRSRSKLGGVSPGVPALLAAIPGVDYVLVEADGARGRSIKAPAAHEPAIPPSATVVLGVAGIEALGELLGEEIAHRPELVAALLDIQPGEPLSPQHIATLLAHQQGGRKGVPASARFIPVINKVEDEALLHGARAVASRLRSFPGVDRVLIGAALSQEPVIEVW